MGKFEDSFEGWYKYAERAAGKPPRPLLVDAVGLAEGRQAALDIGAGALNDAIYLLEAGFAQVTALDAEPIANDIAARLPAERFAYVIARFEDFAFPVDRYDLLNAQYALPFIAPQQFDRVFGAILASLKPGGILTGQLFGDRDDWAGTAGMSFHTIETAQTLLSPLEILSFREEDDPHSQTLSRTSKHWHLYHFIALRR